MKEERPVHPSIGPAAQYALELRQLRQSRGLTYGQLARQTYFSKTVMWEADHGKSLPSSDVTAAFVRACGGNVEEWLRKRKVAEEEIRPRGKQKPLVTLPSPRRAPQPDPKTAVSPSEYVECLKQLIDWAGLSLREIAKRTNELPRRIAPSTLCEAYKRQTLPAIDIVTSLVAVVGIDEAEQQSWIRRWHAIHEGKAKRFDASRTARTVSRLRGRLGDDSLATPLTDQRRRIPSPHQPGDTLEMPLVTEEIRDWVLVDGSWQPFEIEEAANTNNSRPTYLELRILIPLFAIAATLIMVLSWILSA